jgi:hypothetical protein
MKLNHNTMRSFLSIALVTALAISACNNSEKKAGNDSTATDTIVTKSSDTLSKVTAATADTVKVKFDINTIPVTIKDIGTFPYLKAPEAYTYHDISQSDLKTVHFAVYGYLTPVDGKTYSTNIYKKQESEAPFNMLIVQREYDKMIKDLGGVKVSDKLLSGQVEKIGKKLMEDEGDHAYTIIGTNDYTLNHVNTYIIRTAKAIVWVELSFYQNGGYIYILEQEGK